MLSGALATFLLSIVFVMPFAPLSLHTLQLLFFALGLTSSTQVLSYPLIAEINPLSLTGTATGIASIIIMGVGGLAQVLYGTLLQYHDYQVAMWIFPTTAFMALLLALLLQSSGEKSGAN